MALVELPCLIGGDCVFKTIPLEYSQAQEQLDGHMRYAHRPRPDNLPRPEIKLESTAEDWEEFSVTWEQYKAEYSLAGKGLIRQLVASCSEDLRRSLHRQTEGKHYSLTETDLLDHIKQLGVGHENQAVTDTLNTVGPRQRRSKQQKRGKLSHDGWERFEIKKDGEVKLRFSKKKIRGKCKFRCEETVCQVGM